MNEFEEIFGEVAEILIELFPTPIELHRPASLVSDGMGGFVRSGSVVVFPERDRYLEESVEVTKIPMFSATESKGKQFYETHILTTLPDDDIQTGDWFMLNGNKMTVTRVNTNFNYQIQAHVGQEARIFIP